MTMRERIDDWISGGALTDHERGIEILLQSFKRVESLQKAHLSISRARLFALQAIAAEEKPTSNATVKRMARTAREALK